MITDSFDSRSKALIEPSEAVSEKVRMAAKGVHLDALIMTFSSKLIKELLERGVIEVIDEDLAFGSAAAKEPLCRIKGTDTGVFLTGIGAMMASGMIEEIGAIVGVRKFIVFGSCGALVDLPSGRLIVPEEAYRDEGMSYHYAKASDYITTKNASRLAKMFDELGVEYVKGKTWTTDGFYRETEANRDARIAEGCICVEMECSALQAVCDFRDYELYHFLYAADSLDGEWSKRILGDTEMDQRVAYFFLAEKIVSKIV